jgi:hypothetical protein
MRVLESILVFWKSYQNWGDLWSTSWSHPIFWKHQQFISFRKYLFRSFLTGKESRRVRFLWTSHPYSRFQKYGTRSEWSCCAHINLDVIWSLIRLGHIFIVDLEVDPVDYFVHLHSALSVVVLGLPLAWTLFICDVDAGCQPCGKL